MPGSNVSPPDLSRPSSRDGDKFDSSRGALETLDSLFSIRPPPATDLAAELPSVEVRRKLGSAPADFVILSELGSGGMGVVELAEQPALGREVALKRPHAHSPQAAVATLLHEARVTGRLEHPNIIPIHVLAHDPTLGPVVVMKRVRGHAWSDDLYSFDRSDPLALARHVEVLVRVCDAVSYAHAQGVIHRDLKPTNVMLGNFGEVYVVDWGLSLALPVLDSATDGSIVGTPAYMAPEMVDGNDASIDERTDVYLLGATLFHLLYGAPPHEARTAHIAMLSALEAPVFPLAPAIPAELGEICRRACRVDPDDRYGSVAELQEALSGCLEHRSAQHLVAGALADLEAIDDTDAGDRLDRLDMIRLRLRQSQELWPDNPRAIEGVRAVDQRRLAAFLEREDLEASVALAAKLGDVSDAIRGGIEALRAKRRTAQAAADHLDGLRRDRALQVESPARRRVALALLVGFVLTIVYAYTRRGGAMPSDAVFLLKLAAVVNVVWFLIVFVFRKRLLTTFVNRAVMVGMSVAPVAILVHRVAAAYAGHSGLEVVQTDMLLTAIVILALVGLHRGFLVPAVGGLICYFTAVVEPLSARLLINVLPVLMLGSVWVLWRRLELSDQSLVDRADGG